MRTAYTEKLIDQTGLRIRLFIYNLGLNKGDNEVINFFLSGLVSLDVDFFNESPQEVIDKLKNSKFIGYASIIIIINRTKKLCRHGIDKLLEALESNIFLRYKSKVILCHYGIDGHGESAGVVLSSFIEYIEDNGLDREHTVINLQHFIYPRNFKRQKYDPIFQNLNRVYARMDYVHFNSIHLDNTVIMQIFVSANSSRSRILDTILMNIFWNPFQSAQDLLSQGLPYDFRSRVVQSKNNCDLYFYAINPALAIIINNYYFSGQHTVREGSEHDVQHIIRVLKLAGIPYILVEDCDRQELIQVLDFVEKKHFKPLKSFLLFLMSHGDSDDVIYTHDDKLDIKQDVVRRIQANKSLEDVDKLVVVNACRGSIDMEFADYSDIESIQSTECSHLTRNTMVLYSVPNGVFSPRFETTGCPFIQSFCQHFRNIDPTDDIRMVDVKIDKDLKGIKYYEDLEKCSDLVIKDTGQRLNIIQVPMKAMPMLQLIHSISNEFPIRETCDPTPMLSRFMYVCGYLNKIKFGETGNIKDKYFAPELEYETCSLDDPQIGDHSTK